MFWSQGSVTRARETLSKSRKLGLPWQSNGQHSALPLLRAWVQSLVGELRTKVYKLRGAAKKIKTKRKIPSVAWSTEVKEASAAHTRRRLAARWTLVPHA